MSAGGWFDHARRVVVFLLGVAVVLDALLRAHDTATELIIGSIMVGVLPLDTVLAAFGRSVLAAATRPADGEHERDPGSAG
jgi:hypothetical protein